MGVAAEATAEVGAVGAAAVVVEGSEEAARATEEVVGDGAGAVQAEDSGESLEVRLQAIFDSNHCKGARII